MREEDQVLEILKTILFKYVSRLCTSSLCAFHLIRVSNRVEIVCSQKSKAESKKLEFN